MKNSFMLLTSCIFLVFSSDGYSDVYQDAQENKVKTSLEYNIPKKNLIPKTQKQLMDDFLKKEASGSKSLKKEANKIRAKKIADQRLGKNYKPFNEKEDRKIKRNTELKEKYKKYKR